MNATVTEEQELEEVIAKALKKLGKTNENAISRYLPGAEGYMHHFSMRKMKWQNPRELINLIQRHVLDSSNPKSLDPKPRAPRGSRKRNNDVNLSRQDLDRMLHIARLAGDKEMVKKLSPKRDLKAIKRDLISSIRHGRIEPDLWNAYVESATNYATFGPTPTLS